MNEWMNKIKNNNSSSLPMYSKRKPITGAHLYDFTWTLMKVRILHALVAEQPSNVLLTSATEMLCFEVVFRLLTYTGVSEEPGL